MKQWLMKIWAVICLAGIALLFGLGAAAGKYTASLVWSPMAEEKGRCIVIDAGHGGEDGGAASCTGRVESSYNLEIALRVEPLLQFLGYKTRMIRRTDTSVSVSGETIAQRKVSDLQERVRIASEDENQILLSIHQNYYQDAACTGAQVFYGRAEGSRQLAEIIQFSLGNALGSHRKCKEGKGIYLLEKTAVPSVMVECGFLSNPEETRLLESPGYQKQLGCILASALTLGLGDP